MSLEIVAAIRAIARDEADALRIWDEPTYEQSLAVWARVTDNGLRDSTDYSWGVAGSRWAAAAGIVTAGIVTAGNPGCGRVSGPGRKPLPDGAGKTARIEMRVRPDTKSWWLACATGAGLGLQEWIEQCCPAEPVTAGAQNTGRPSSAARWYCVSRDGVATLCADEADARAEAQQSDLTWSTGVPHLAVQLAVVGVPVAAGAAGCHNLDRRVSGTAA
jgi:hypothetical protein